MNKRKVRFGTSLTSLVFMLEEEKKETCQKCVTMHKKLTIAQEEWNETVLERRPITFPKRDAETQSENKKYRKSQNSCRCLRRIS